VCCYIQRAINNFTAKGKPRCNRVLHRALERLELLEAKVSRAVLRGGDGGNTASLPDQTEKEQQCHLAGWLPYLGNRHFENGIPFLYRLQTKAGEGKIGSRHCVLMLERQPSHMKEKRML
jgi:hypothetical protein